MDQRTAITAAAGYSLVGDLLSTCGCRTRLPGGGPPEGHAALVYRISRGWIGEVDLAGRTVVLLQGAFPLYLDEEAAPVQLLAITDALHAGLHVQLAAEAGWAGGSGPLPERALQVPIQVRYDDGVVLLGHLAPVPPVRCAHPVTVRSLVLSEPAARTRGA